MAKGPSPLLGYNTNVRHKARVFHIQTEDSGIQHPHIITHLFADGGRILKSVKTPYGELLESPDWVPQVKKIMQDQHKAMFIALKDGQYDSLIDGTAAPGKAGTAGATPGPQPAAPIASPAAVTPQHSMPATAPTGPAIRRPSSPAIVATPTLQSPPVAANPAQPPGANTSAAQPSPPAKPSVAGIPAVQPPASAGAPGAGPPSNRTGRYTPVRSPDVLGSFKPKSDPAPVSGNIFGDALMSEKSLDEVILAYLAEDLDDKKR